MVIALAGIIAMQLLWMRNAVRVRNELFDRSVNEAMIATSQRVEKLHEVSIIRNIYGNNVPMPFQFDGNYEPGSRPMGFPDSMYRANPNRRSMPFDSVLMAMEKHIDLNLEIDSFYNQPEHKGRVRHFNNRAPRRYAFGPERLKNTAGKMFYEVWTKGLDAFSDTTLINSVLHDELAERNINLPFFVGISAPDTALLVSGGADSLKLIDSEYVVPL
ncbi:MAG: hypothetical protein JW735_06785, partial [Prolixibacteraceae bacterium]|nr:hypothetical protein [Prolixibacteraceae bacterium]